MSQQTMEAYSVVGEPGFWTLQVGFQYLFWGMQLCHFMHVMPSTHRSGLLAEGCSSNPSVGAYAAE